MYRQVQGKRERERWSASSAVVTTSDDVVLFLFAETCGTMLMF